jgi:hypothetical protein
MHATSVISGGYTVLPQKFYHPSAARNTLGLVGGNDVSVASGNLVDVESELRNITRDLSKDPTKNYRPSCQLGEKSPEETFTSLKQGDCAPKSFGYLERSTGRAVWVDMTPLHLRTQQYVTFPGVPAPEPLKMEIYNQWRF